MNLPDGTHLAYHVYDEQNTGLPPCIRLMAGFAGGSEIAWEVFVSAHNSGPPRGLRLTMYDYSWRALAELPEFFAGLPQADSLDEVRGLIDALGAVDETGSLAA